MKKVLLATGFTVFFGLLAFLAFNKIRLERSGLKSIKDVTPGITSVSDIKSVLGRPVSESEGQLKYPSSNPNFNSEILVEEEKAVFVKEIIAPKDLITYQSLVSQHGEAETILYGGSAIMGYGLYVYPEKGVAFIANPIGEAVLEIWHFKPTTLEEFMKTWGANYTTDKESLQRNESQ